jgi:inactivated superfamily I helicase
VQRPLANAPAHDQNQAWQNKGKGFAGLFTVASTQVPKSQLAELYQQDYCLWAEQTAQRLKEGDFSVLDLASLIEEVEGMSGSQKRALLSNLRVLLMHLLKYQYQPEQRLPSWRSTIIEHRLRLADAFEESPSLKAYFLDNFDKTYQKTRKQAALETELLLATFPQHYPFSADLVLNLDWLPE